MRGGPGDEREGGAAVGRREKTDGGTRARALLPRDNADKNASAGDEDSSSILLKSDR